MLPKLCPVIIRNIPLAALRFADEVLRDLITQLTGEFSVIMLNYARPDTTWGIKNTLKKGNNVIKGMVSIFSWLSSDRAFKWHTRTDRKQRD